MINNLESKMERRFLVRVQALAALLFVQTGMAAAGGTSAFETNGATRTDSLFNFGWKFHYGDAPGAEQTGYDDSQWRTVDLPHDYQFEQPWDSTAIGGRGYKPLGSGWYRKTFEANPTWKKRRVLVDFEGMMQNGEVWLNGQKIGDDYYGYLGFDADISSLLRYDRPNLLAVKTRTDARSRWYTGGGINRDVHLVVKDSVSVARHGVYVATPRITDAEADVNVQVELDCPRSMRKDVLIRATVFSPDGRPIGVSEMSAPTLTKLRFPEVKLPSICVRDPQLWSCDTPVLYQVKVSVLYRNREVDEVSEEFGIRTIAFREGEGFLLNGKKLFLKGIACHHDLGVLGAAAYETGIARLFRQLKTFGYNLVRTSHNPYSESFLREADRQGFIIVSEFTDKWADVKYWAGSIPFSQYWPKGIPEWIKRDRNHPSVVLWSLGNELQMREDLCGYDTGDWGITTYRMLDVLAKRYDQTRPTTVAMFPSRRNGIDKHDSIYRNYLVAPELATVTDVASFNYCYDAYQSYLEHNPQLNIFQSEASTNELAAAYYGMDRRRMVGLAYWGAVEYWGETSGWPKKGWDYSFFNHTLEPYPQAYLMKASFEEDKPLVHIAVVDEVGEQLEWNDIISGRMKLSDHWNRQPGSRQNLFTYTNAEEVELFLNGRSLGIQHNDTTDIHKRNMMYWKNIPYEAGILLAVARKEGREVARHEIETAGEAVALKAVCENVDWRANGTDLQYIRIYAVDKKGRRAPLCDGTVRFEVNGEATLLATDNGDHYTNDLPAVNPKQMKNGFVMAVFRATRTAGKVTIDVRSDKLKGVKLKLQTLKNMEKITK